MVRNSFEESHPLIPTSASRQRCDDEETILTMPSVTTTPPPYSDGRVTPRPVIPQFTPPTTEESGSHDERPVLNIYARDVDVQGIQSLFERYSKTGDVQPTINYHIRSSGATNHATPSSSALTYVDADDDEESGPAWASEAGMSETRKMRRRRQDQRCCIEALSIVFGCLAVMVIFGFISFIVYVKIVHGGRKGKGE